MAVLERAGRAPAGRLKKLTKVTDKPRPLRYTVFARNVFHTVCLVAAAFPLHLRRNERSAA